MFKNKVLMISGGTGSFGNAVLRRFSKMDFSEIRIFSRDEKKQDDMRNLYRDKRIKFYLGDVRDYKALENVMRGVDFLFHAAALKQVPSCEFYPMEAVKTNIIGTDNVLTAAINYSVKKVICLSTDKAVYPINAMGISKAMMEKVILSKCRDSKKTKICITRYGNVIASRGSVIPLFASQISSGVPLSITDPNMTRFMMTLDDAINLVLFAFEKGNSGDIFVQKAPASTIETVARSLCSILGKKDHQMNIIGTRHGEKLHEVLLSREEMVAAEDLGDFFRVIPDVRDLNYDKFFKSGEREISGAQDYNSHNTKRLDFDQTVTLLKKVHFIQSLLKENKVSSEP